MDRDFVVRKQVQNRAIVREVDQARQRELVRTGLIFVAFLIVAMFAAWQHHEAWRLETAAAVLHGERARELEIQRHLQLETAALRAPARIARIATTQLKMKAPTRETATVLDRVSVATLPASVVASR
ncbi:MAG: cell division protein FtsL [Luteitalea sp.]|nr:cell division protein FtsL [Acidobacteriota bacterium]